MMDIIRDGSDPRSFDESISTHMFNVGDSSHTQKKKDRGQKLVVLHTQLMRMYCHANFDWP